MPKVKVNGITINYQDTGSGEPLVFISGLGASQQLWYLQSLYFKDHYRVITFDNRGVGESDKPETPYSMEMMAQDLLELLDKIGIYEPVNLVGASMGGLIAQSFIHANPRRVSKLVLCCTGISLKDPRFTPAGQDVVEKIFTSADNREKYVDNLLSVMYHPNFVKNTPQLKTLLMNPEVEPQPAYAYMNQLNGCVNDNAFYEWLADIKVPTLILHGREDRVFPLQNALTLKEGLGNQAELCIIEKAAHVFFQEKFTEVNQKLQQFLQKQA